MICPSCGYSNLAGVDDCESCGQELVDSETPYDEIGIASKVAATPIAKVKAPPTIIVPPTATVEEVVDKLVAGNVGCALVVADGAIVGIFSERDVLLKIAPRFAELKSSPIRGFMTPDPETLPPDATIAWALNRMDVGGFRHIPIVDKGKPLGVVSIRDLLRHLAAAYSPAA